MPLVIAFHFPIFVPDVIPIRGGAGLFPVPTVDALAKTKLSCSDVRQGKMSHIKIRKDWLVFPGPLAVTQAETEKRDLVTVALARFGLQVAGVVPPLGLVVGMRIVIGRKRQRSAGQGKLVCEPTRLTLPSRRREEGEKKGNRAENYSKNCS